MEWLLEEDNPSVRYFTLTEIQEKPQNSPEVGAAKKAIMTDRRRTQDTFQNEQRRLLGNP